MRDDRDNLIVTKSFEYALRIIEYAEILENNRKFVLANQILKSGTSIRCKYQRSTECRKQS